MIETTKQGGRDGANVEKPKEVDSAAESEARAGGEVLIVHNTPISPRQPRPPAPEPRPTVGQVRPAVRT